MRSHQQAQCWTKSEVCFLLSVSDYFDIWQPFGDRVPSSKVVDEKSRNPAALRVLTHLPLNKMVVFSQTTFSNAFSWIKTFEFWLLKAELIWSQHWFRYCLGAEKATSHYLKQCWHSSSTHICGIRGRRAFLMSSHIDPLIIKPHSIIVLRYYLVFYFTLFYFHVFHFKYCSYEHYS